ncbi:sigma-70 family RNA polymerase sigma factor [Solibacillus silvestris]|uniref:sigma-70 family RNA polymerase sigma factor n=1 Tax=Solibacillus silvestris TaxID=76853 RepID=UPI003F7DA00C
MEGYLTNDTAKLPNEAIIDDLMQHYGEDVLKLVMQYVHNNSVAEDLTQEIFVKCFRALPSFQYGSSLKTWLWRIAINHSKDYLKSWYAKNVEAKDDEVFMQVESSVSVEQEVIQQQEDDDLVNEVMTLPVKYREVIYLCYYEEQSMKEMAEVLQINENTVKTRLRKGKQLLKQLLEREENG